MSDTPRGRGPDLGLVAGLIVLVGGLVLAVAFCRQPAVEPSAAPTPTLIAPALPPTAAPTVPATSPPTARPVVPTPTLQPTPMPVPDPVAEAAGIYKPSPALRSSGCQYQRATNGAVLPDGGCTTGATDPRLTKDVICAPGFTTKPYRDGPLAMPGPVTQQVKDAAYAAYGVTSHPPGAYEVDHLIPLEDGGSDDPRNLWPQPADPRPGFRTKDQVETASHQAICSGAMSLAEVQRLLATDWTQLLARLGQQRLAAIAPKQHDGDVESDE